MSNPRCCHQYPPSRTWAAFSAAAIAFSFPENSMACGCVGGSCCSAWANEAAAQPLPRAQKTGFPLGSVLFKYVYARKRFKGAITAPHDAVDSLPEANSPGHGRRTRT